MSTDPNPYAPPRQDQPGVPLAGPPGQPQRGGCLTAFLVLMLVVNPLVGIFYFVGGTAIERATHGYGWAPPALGLLCFANVACAVGVWRYKRWGVYGFVAMAAVGLVINFFLGIGAASVLGALVGPILLVALVRASWSRFT